MFAKLVAANVSYVVFTRSLTDQVKLFFFVASVSFLWFGVRPQPVGLTRNPVDKIEDVCEVSYRQFFL